MAKTAIKVQLGDVVNIVADAGYSVGDPIAFGARVGIASTDVALGGDVALQLEGVFQFTATEADTIALGDKIYLDNVGGILATTTLTSNQVIGYAVTEKAGATVGTVNVKLGA